MRRPLRFLAMLAMLFPGAAWAAIPSGTAAPPEVQGAGAPETPASGSIHFSSDGIIHRITSGRRSDFLSVSMQVENRSDHALEIKPLDLWAEAGSGTVLSEPGLRQDGLAVAVATVGSGQNSVVELSFLLGPSGPFDRFTLHWGGRLREQSLTGEVEFVEGEDGFHPASGQDAEGGSEVVEGLQGYSVISEEIVQDVEDPLYGEPEEEEFEAEDEEDHHYRDRSYSSVSFYYGYPGIYFSYGYPGAYFSYGYPFYGFHHHDRFHATVLLDEHHHGGHDGFGDLHPGHHDGHHDPHSGHHGGVDHQHGGHPGAGDAGHGSSGRGHLSRDTRGAILRQGRGSRQPEPGVRSRNGFRSATTGRRLSHRPSRAGDRISRSRSSSRSGTVGSRSSHRSSHAGSPFSRSRSSFRSRGAVPRSSHRSSVAGGRVSHSRGSFGSRSARTHSSHRSSGVSGHSSHSRGSFGSHHGASRGGRAGGSRGMRGGRH